MFNRPYVPGKAASITIILLALIACDQSKPASPGPAAAAPSAAATEKVFVVFDGPWAFASDPKDPNIVLAIAPKTKAHRDLQVSASNKSILASGTYDLSVPAHSSLTADPSDSIFAQAQIDAKSLEHALNAKSERYVIRLPKPEAYVPAMRYRSRVGPGYPPDPATEKEYATSASLRYGVNSLAGFSLAGTPDSGSFNPLLLQVDTPTITFLIDPAVGDLPLDSCLTHSREAFRDLTKLLNITLYVDFPDSSSVCHDKDPQKSRATKAAVSVTPLQRLAALLGGRLPDTPLATAGLIEITSGDPFLSWPVPTDLATKPLAAFYFFGIRPQDCHSPTLILKSVP